MRIEVDGRAVRGVEHGEGSGLPLLCLHGFAGEGGEFSDSASVLGRARRVLLLDLPGHGGSQGPDQPGGYGVEALGAWVVRVAEALGLGDFHLLGHGFGGLVAQRVAAASSQRLASLILTGTGLGALRPEAAQRVATAAVTARGRGVPAAATEDPSLFAATGSGRDPQADAVVGGARGLIGSAPLGAFLRGIDIPVLVVAGEHDDLYTADEQRLLAETVHDARFALLEGAGHRAHVDAPQRWADVVGRFLAASERSS